MTVFEVLSEMIRPVELLGLVALVKFVHVSEMVYSSVPVRLRKVGKFFATKAAGVVERAVGPLRLGCCGRMEGGAEAGDSRTRPRVSSQV